MDPDPENDVDPLDPDPQNCFVIALIRSPPNMEHTTAVLREYSGVSLLLLFVMLLNIF